MRRKLIRFLSSLHGGLVIFLLLSLPVSVIYSGETAFFLRASTIFFAVFLSDFAITQFKHLITYLCVCAVTAVFFFFGIGTALPEQIYLCAAAVLVFLVRIPARIHKEADILQIPNCFCLILFILVYILGVCIKIPAICTAAYRLAFCYLILLILYTNLANMDRFLSQNKEMANLPGKQILSTNRMMLGGFTVLTLFFMILIPASGISRLASSLGDFFLWVLRTLFSLIPSGETQEIAEATQAAAENMGNAQMLPSGNDPPPWLTVLLHVLFLILCTVIAIGLLIGLFYLIIQLFHRFYQPIQENNDKQEFIKTQKRETAARNSEKRQESLSFFHRFHPDAAVRRIFKKSVKKGLSSSNGRLQKDLFCLTPSELEQAAGIKEQDSEGILQEVYEKARYSKEGCDKSDVERVKASGWK